MPKRKRATGTGEQVEPKVQETSIVWYRGAKMVDVFTTCYSDIALFKRRGWEPETGAVAKAGAPYLHFRLPRKAFTIRSKASVGKKRKAPRSKS